MTERSVWLLGREIAQSWREFVVTVVGLCSSAVLWVVHSLQYEPHLWQNLLILGTFITSALGFVHKVVSVYFRNPSKDFLKQREQTEQAIEELVEEKVREANLQDEVDKAKQSRIARKERDRALLNLVKRRGKE